MVLSLLGLALCAGVYAPVVQHLRRAGGQVRPEGFRPVDVVVASGLALLFGGLALLGALKPAPEEQDAVTWSKLLGSSGIFALIIASLVAFLSRDGRSPVELFGLGRISALRTFGFGLALVLGAFPAVALASALAQRLLEDAADEQQLVQLFREAASSGDSSMMATVFFTGVIVAPICEEILFRGYFYGVGKRFAGPWISGCVTSLVFAAFHGNLHSLAGLSMLAAALNLAYERTGSLLVPITMHALFNGTSLGLLYLQATGYLGVP